MNPKTQQQRRELRRQQAGLAVALVLVAVLAAPARAQQTAREVAAKKWYASQNSENRSSGGRANRRPIEEARQQVRLGSREPAGGRAQHALAPVDREASWCQPASSTWSVVQLTEEAVPPENFVLPVG